MNTSNRKEDSRCFSKQNTGSIKEGSRCFSKQKPGSIKEGFDCFSKQKTGSIKNGSRFKKNRIDKRIFQNLNDIDICSIWNLDDRYIYYLESR